MKKLLFFWSLLAIAIGFTACNNDDLKFEFDEEGNGLLYRPVTEQPLFYLALVAVILGFQLFLAGFICELVSRNSSERNNYKIKEEI